MKRIILILMLAAFSVAGFAKVDRTATILKGRTMLSKPMTFTAADSIVTSDTLDITITNKQEYMQFQTFTITLTDVDGGSPSVSIIAYGKVNSTDSWTAIGSEVTWTGESDNPGTITSTAAYNYNYLLVRCIASAAVQHLQVATFTVKTANGFNTGSLTLTAGNDLIGSSTSDITMNTDKFTVAGATGNTAIAGTLGVTGLITANGGVTLGAGDDLIGSSTSDITINTNKFTVAGATGNTVIAGALDLNNKLDVGDTQAGGAANGSVIKKELQAGEDYTTTTAALMVKNYGNATATVSSGEFTGLYVNVKGLHTSPGDNASIISGHVHGDNTTTIHAGLWLYGDVENGFKLSNGTSTYGLNLSQQTVSTADLILSNDETISNVTDGYVAVSGAVTAPSVNFITAAQLTIPATDSLVIVNASIPALSAGLTLEFVAEASVTGATTLTLNGVIKNVYEASDISALEANDIRDTQYVVLKYDGTQWQQISQSGN